MIEPDHLRLTIVCQCELASIAAHRESAPTMENDATLRFAKWPDICGATIEALAVNWGGQ